MGEQLVRHARDAPAAVESVVERFHLRASVKQAFRDECDRQASLKGPVYLFDLLAGVKQTGRNSGQGDTLGEKVVHIRDVGKCAQCIRGDGRQGRASVEAVFYGQETQVAPLLDGTYGGNGGNAL